MNSSSWWARESQLDFMTRISPLRREELTLKPRLLFLLLTLLSFPDQLTKFDSAKERVNNDHGYYPFPTHNREAVHVDREVCGQTEVTQKSSRRFLYCCGLNVCVLPQFLCCNPTPQVAHFRRFDFGKLLDYEGGAFMIGVGALV